ncbi:MAG: D-xylose transport system permease protein [Cellvibrionaceae bacterium]|jgi:D-xylose transport system permease protein
MSEITNQEFSGGRRQQQTLSEYISSWWSRIKAGDLGSLPIIVGLILIISIFGYLAFDKNFFTPRNYVNLLLQVSGIASIATGVVFVLLIGEIDLSLAFVGAVGSVAMTLLLVGGEDGANWPWWAAVGVALLTTTLIGFLHGVIITRAGVPSFVVTLAGLLAWSGVVLILTTQYSRAGTIVIQDPVVKGVANSFLPTFWAWTVYTGVIIAFAINEFYQRTVKLRQNLAVKPVGISILQIAGLALITGGAVFYAHQDEGRGVPTSIVIVLVFLFFWTFISTRTRFGRYVYAVGGNPEAARRAGINVDMIRIACFMISSFMGGVGGIILASRLGSVSTNTGGGNLLLNSIAAAVIGGTSLFGGTGRVSSALLGALVIASVENGMGLMGWNSGVKFVVNGLVLLAAVLVDAYSRRSRASSGIA